MKLQRTNIRILAGNGKVGASFSIPNVVTCPGRTKTCESLCYVDIWPMSAPSPKNFRARNYQYVIEALKKSDQLSKELITACIVCQSETIRIHDSGDFFSPEYVRQWLKACSILPDVQFWAYTRSFTVGPILAELAKLARLDNVAIWLSADQDNWMIAMSTLQQYPEFAGISFMETPGCDPITDVLAARLSPQKYVNFPTHIPGGRIKKGVDVDKDVPQCPAILGIAPHAKYAEDVPACVACRKCLPIETKLGQYDHAKIERARSKRFKVETSARIDREIQRGIKVMKLDRAKTRLTK